MKVSRNFHSKSLLTSATKGATYTTQEVVFGLLILALILVLVSVAHAHARHVVRNYQPHVRTLVFIKLEKCHDIELGQYMCNEVRFVPQEVRVNDVAK